MFVLIALLFPGVLLGLMLAMGRVESRLSRGLFTDQVEWMLRSELPAETVETNVAEGLVQPLSTVSEQRPS